MIEYPATSRRRGFRLLSVLTLIVVLTGLACNVTVPGVPTQTPPALPTDTPAPTFPPQPTQLPVNLPPALVESAPLPESEIGLKQPFIFYFNQAMEKGTVEAALQAQPPVAGSFKWLNDYSVSFTPDQPLPKDTSLTVTLSTKARAAKGLPLSAPVDISFHTAAGFQAVERLPLPDASSVGPGDAVLVTFNRPIVPLGGDATQAPAAFSLEPSAKGRGEWLNTSTYIFYPAPGLAGGVKYSVNLNKDLVSTDGIGWAAASLPDWSFTTRKPSLMQVTPAETSRVYLDAPVVLTFDQAMDPASVAQNFSLLDQDGSPVPGKTSWNEQGAVMTFKPDALLRRAADYTLTLSGKAQSSGGTPLGKDYSAKLTTVAPMGVAGVDLAAGQPLRITNGFASLHFYFTAPLANTRNLERFFSFDPAVDVFNANAGSEGTDVYLSGTFAASADYTLTISEDLADNWGQKLKAPYVFKFKTGALQPSLNINIPDSFTGSVFLTPNDTALPAQAANVKNLTVRYAGLSLEDFVTAANIAAFDRQQKFQGPQLSSFSKTIDLPPDKNAPVEIPITPDGSGLKPGLYYYVIQSPDLPKPTPAPASLLMVVSNIQLTLKVSANEVFVWAVSLDSNKPLSGAKISLYQDNKGALASLGEVTTDGNGTASLSTPTRSDPYAPVYAVSGKPGDPNFSLSLSTWNSGLGAWEFGLSTTTSGNQPFVYLYTDRPIYRPGQTIDLRAVLRQEYNGRYSLSSLKKLTIRIFGDYSPASGEQPLLAKVPVNLSDFGAGSASYTLPAAAQPGFYHMEVEEVTGSYLPFQVADYRKPEIDLSVAFSKAEQNVTEDMTATVKALYFFGAPADNLSFNWTLTSSRSYFNIPGLYQTGTFDPQSFAPLLYSLDQGMGKFVANGQGTIGTDGTAMIKVPADMLQSVSPGNIQQLQLNVDLNGQGDFPVSAHAQMTLHPANFYIGVKPEAWSGQAKQEAGFSVQTVDWQAKPYGNQSLTAAFKKATWKDNPDWTPASSLPLMLVEYSDVGSTDFQTDAQGQARIAFTPPSAGTYLVDVREKSAQGQTAHTQVLFWAGGEGSTTWPALPNQQIPLTADADEYTAGAKARIFIPNPLGDAALALITVERGKVMRSIVTTVSGSSYALDLPLSAEDAPNVYVSVILLGKNANQQPDFRVGYVELKVKPDAEILQVDLTPQPAQVQPSGDVKFSILVKDSQGKPVQGEFSLSVVDKAVLALADPNAPDIRKAFYDPQPLGVSSSLSLSASGRRLAVQEPGGRGGGGGGLAAPPSVRQNFQDTAYWNGDILTDANGAAEVSLKLPDNLTTWVVTVRGLSQDSRVGEAVKEVVVTKDLLIRPLTPRFLVAGDHVELAAMVNNNTAQALNVDVSIQASGLDLDDPAQANQKVNVQANGRQRVSWWVKVQDTAKADLLFSARANDLQDASRPALGSIPVEVYSSPQTYGTSGILSEAGEQLEVVSIPRSFTPTGGELRVEAAPSLAAAILDGLKAMDAFPGDFTEPVLSRLLPNLETLRILQDLGLNQPNLKEQLQAEIQTGLQSILDIQNKDGGWGWASGEDSDTYLTAYVLFGLARAVKAGLFVDAGVISKAQTYVQAGLIAPAKDSKDWMLDRLSFEVYALQVSGSSVQDAGGLYAVWNRLSPWAKALLAMTLDAKKAGDPRAREILSDLSTHALRSSSGAYWETSADNAQVNYASANFTTAVVLTALAHFDPASPLLADGVRNLVAHRRFTGGWDSSFESAWILLALADTLQGTGDLQASFAFSATLNGSPLLNGQAGGANALTPVEARVPLSSLSPDAPNALKLTHEAGDGRLYYRAFLQVDRPVETAPALDQGLSITRAYYAAGQDCRKVDCQPVSSVSLAVANPTLLVRLTVTVPHPMYSVVVEDFIPAGAEIVDLTLKTSPQPVTPDVLPIFDSSNPFGNGWGGWFFGSPTLYDDHIRWVASTLPAGTYQLTYQLTPLQAGEFRLLPAHAYQFYFPDVQGTSTGAIFKITP